MTFLGYIVVLFSLISYVRGGTLNDSTTLVNNLLATYNKNVRPVNNHETKTNVSILTYLKSIQEFDEVKESFAYTGAFAIAWYDAAMVWDPAAYGGVDFIKISYKEVWVPDLVLTTPTEEIESFGKSWQKVSYDHTGQATWLPGGLMKSTCSVNVANYPFDKQTCKSDFTVWGYHNTEVKLFPVSNQVDITLFSGNVAWVLEGTKVKIADVNGWSQLEVTYFLRRKPAFIVINIIMPILFLSLINVLVFILVPESGERVSYCITVLLSIAVFMTIISDTLPKSSEPLPIISYKLMFDMIISSLITLVTILNLRLYNNDDRIPVPEWLKSVYIFSYRRRKCKSRPSRSETKVHPKVTEVLTVTNGNEVDIIEKSNAGKPTYPTGSISSGLKRQNTEDAMLAEDVTWKEISKFVDCLSLCVFTLLTGLSFGTFLTYVSQN